MLSWYLNFTLCCVPHIQPSQYQHQNFALNYPPHVNIKISIFHQMLPSQDQRHNSKFRPNAVRRDSTFSTQPSSSAVPSLQPTFARRRAWTAWEPAKTIIYFYFLPLNVVSLTTLSPFLFCLSLRSSKG
jgi:hypothetical protein